MSQRRVRSQKSTKTTEKNKQLDEFFEFLADLGRLMNQVEFDDRVTRLVKMFEVYPHMRHFTPQFETLSAAVVHKHVCEAYDKSKVTNVTNKPSEVAVGVVASALAMRTFNARKTAKELPIVREACANIEASNRSAATEFGILAEYEASVSLLEM